MGLDKLPSGQTIDTYFTCSTRCICPFLAMAGGTPGILIHHPIKILADLPFRGNTRWWFQIIFTPKLGEDEPILTHIFELP